jgi:hypothetical protein
MLISSVIETIKFYADSGDLLTAAYISLVFFEDIIEVGKKYLTFLRRILKSYFDMLEQLQLHSQVAELIKYGPENIVWIKDIEKKSPQLNLMCPYC